MSNKSNRENKKRTSRKGLYLFGPGGLRRRDLEIEQTRNSKTSALRRGDSPQSHNTITFAIS